MQGKHKIWLLAGTLAALIVAGCTKKETTTTEGTPTDGGGSKLVIAVVPKGNTHDFWKAVHAGSETAAKELGDVTIQFGGPEKEDDREQQISLMQSLVSTGVAAIVLAPLDKDALLAPVKQATAAKIPVVIIDSGLSGEVGTDFVSLVATDNYKGGQMAGEEMIKLLGGKGSVLILRYQEGSESTEQREKGFTDAIAKAPGIKLLDPKQYAGATRATAQAASENLLTANSAMQGIFCPNESSTFGMLLVLRQRQMAGKVKFIGFDSSEGLVEAMAKGEINGLIVQNPFKIGYEGVKAAHAYIKGEKVEPRIDTGVVYADKVNMNTEDMKKVLSPDLSILTAK